VSKVYYGKKDLFDPVIAPFNARMSSQLIPSVRGLYADGDTVIALFKASATVKDGKRLTKTNCLRALAPIFCLEDLTHKCKRNREIRE